MSKQAAWRSENGQLATAPCLTLYRECTSITRNYSIDEAPQAFADLEARRNARKVIVFR
jgi:hypothetical protein